MLVLGKGFPLAMTFILTTKRHKNEKHKIVLRVNYHEAKDEGRVRVNSDQAIR